VTAPSVGLFTYSTLPRGSVVHAACLAEALCALGWDATLYALDKDGRGFFRTVKAPLVLVPASPAPASLAELVRLRAVELSEFVASRSIQHDIYHAEDCLSANALLRLGAVGRPVPLARTVHHVESFADPALARCQERSIRDAALCLAVSAETQREVLRAFGVHARRITNGVYAERFSCVDESRLDSVRRRLGFDGGPVLLSLGGVEERKNTVRALRAFARVRQTHPRAVFWIVGGATVLDHGAYRAAFEREMQGLPLETRAAVSELGTMADEDLPAIFRIASALVFPSLHEGFGLAALEALAAGLPLVASRRPPLTEFLDDECATLVDPESEESIAQGIERALNAPLRQREAGRRRAALHSWRSVAQAHIGAYASVLRASPEATAATRSL
jgi:glycosyltransferase-like protein